MVIHICVLKVWQAIYELKLFIQVVWNVAEVIYILLSNDTKSSDSHFCILQEQPSNSWQYQLILLLSHTLFPCFCPLQGHKIWLTLENNQRVLCCVNVFDSCFHVLSKQYGHTSWELITEIPLPESAFSCVSEKRLNLKLVRAAFLRHFQKSLLLHCSCFEPVVWHRMQEFLWNR